MGELKALRRMDRHDLHEIGADGRKRSRRLLRGCEMIGVSMGKGGDAAGIRLESADDARRLGKVAREAASPTAPHF